MKCGKLLDLIETQWNVKAHPAQAARQKHYRFNRDIVECKDLCGDSLKHVRQGFNRDIVECKVTTQQKLGIQTQGFNRDIVECKVASLFNIISLNS